MSELKESARLKFESGNGTQVTRASITREEYEALIAAPEGFMLVPIDIFDRAAKAAKGCRDIQSKGEPDTRMAKAVYKTYSYGFDDACRLMVDYWNKREKIQRKTKQRTRKQCKH